MANLGVLILAVGIAGLAAMLARRGLYWSTGLVLVVWLVSAIWSWSSSTDNRHPDYSLAFDGGDPRLIFAINSLLFGMPLYLIGVFIGLAFRFWHVSATSQTATSEID